MKCRGEKSKNCSTLAIPLRAKTADVSIGESSALEQISSTLIGTFISIGHFRNILYSMADKCIHRAMIGLSNFFFSIHKTNVMLTGLVDCSCQMYIIQI